MKLRGWVELDGRVLSCRELAGILGRDPEAASRFGGEFLLSFNGCMARDPLGLVPGPVPPGTIICEGTARGRVLPAVPLLSIEDAIREAVRLRSTEGVCALSGGVDSSLIACLAGLPCLSIGMPGSHDLIHADLAAKMMEIPCTQIEVTESDILEGLNAVIGVIPDPTPLSTTIAVTQYLITRSASELGHRRVLTGQGADELFGGYARYRGCPDPGAELARDRAGLARQALRDQSVAAINHTCLSYPYLDLRVVRAAGTIPPMEMNRDGVGKWPLREVAARFIPRELAWYPKKAMQYGTGVARQIQMLARHNGYKRSLQGYLDQIRTSGGGA